MTLSANKPEYTGIPDNSGGGSVTTKDEGSTIVATTTTLNFVGAGVTASDGGGGTATVTIPGGSGAIDHTVVGGTTIISKSIDESVASGTLQDDDEFTLSIVSGRTYSYEVLLSNDSAAGNVGIQARMNGTATTSAAAFFHLIWGADAIQKANTGVGTTLPLTGTGTNFNGPHTVFMLGSIICTGNGTLKVQWAQNLGDAGNPTTVKKCSYFAVTRVT